MVSLFEVNLALGCELLGLQSILKKSFPALELHNIHSVLLLGNSQVRMRIRYHPSTHGKLVRVFGRPLNGVGVIWDGL